MGQFEAIIGVNPWTALFVLLNTLTIFFVGKKYLFGPVMKMIQSRQREIDDMYADADQAKTQAAALQSQLEEKLAVAEQTGERMVREAVARGQSRQEDIIRQANSQADAMLEKAQADIAQEKKKAINEAKNEIAGLAMDIAGKVVESTLSDGDRARLVDRFIEELGEGI